MYRYFIQPQIDTQNNSIVGYELLLKEYTKEGWRPPEDFAAISPELTAPILEESVKRLALKVDSISVNLNQKQMRDVEMNKTLIRIQNILRPVHLIVELTEDPKDSASGIRPLIEQINRYVERNIKISLDDVGVGMNSVAMFNTLRPYLSEVKFALQDFDEGIEVEEMKKMIRYWHKVAIDNQLRFVFEGVENQSVLSWLASEQIYLHQGYYYGKPKLLRITPDDPD